MIRSTFAPRRCEIETLLENRKIIITFLCPVIRFRAEINDQETRPDKICFIESESIGLTVAETERIPFDFLPKSIVFCPEKWVKICFWGGFLSENVKTEKVYESMSCFVPFFCLG